MLEKLEAELIQEIDRKMDLIEKESVRLQKIRDVLTSEKSEGQQSFISPHTPKSTNVPPKNTPSRRKRYDELIELLSIGPCHRNDLKQEMGVTGKTLGNLVYAARKNGAVINYQKGEYYMVSYAHETQEENKNDAVEKREHNTFGNVKSSSVLEMLKNKPLTPEQLLKKTGLKNKHAVQCFISAIRKKLPEDQRIKFAKGVYTFFDLAKGQLHKKKKIEAKIPKKTNIVKITKIEDGRVRKLISAMIVRPSLSEREAIMTSGTDSKGEFLKVLELCNSVLYPNKKIVSKGAGDSIVYCIQGGG